MKNILLSIAITTLVSATFSNVQAAPPDTKSGPSTPVQVINTTASPVPVTVPGGISISGTVPVTITNQGASPTPYQASSGCFGALVLGEAQCDMAFPAVPAGKRLIVEHVTMEANLVTAGAKIVRMAGTGGYFSPVFVGRCCLGSAADVWALNIAVLDFVEPGSQPAIQTIATSQLNMNGTITGYLVNL